MKNLSSDLIALFKTRSFFAANLFTVSLIGGAVLRYTSVDYDIAYGGNKFLCGGVTGPFFERSPNTGGSGISCSWKAGLEVSTLTVDIMPGSATIGGIPFLTACINGVFDGATFKRERAYMPKGGDVATGAVILDLGRITEIAAGRSYATFSVADFRELLNISMPRNLYQPGCMNSLYDASCGLNKADFTSTGTASTGSTRSAINTSLAQSTGYFDLGVITFTSGANAGAARTVKSYVSGVVNTITPFPTAPANGDSFSIYRGCDKSYLGGCTTLSNTARFKGMPALPSAGTAM